jgi:hypothetical protein
VDLGYLVAEHGVEELNKSDHDKNFHEKVEKNPRESGFLV